ncbi:MAG: hypothetical protein K8R02_00885 [Anaerohalosphaeraceae bacterium]|nr:hypothetical protein [Anaerohalosphaeraceae bacterium]
MNEFAQRKISVTEPIAEAVEKTRILLFRPFDIGKWFVLGFSAWLMCLVNGVGFNFNFGGNNFNSGGQGEVFKNFVCEHIVLIGTLVGVFGILFIAVFIVCLWLSSRGYFMFLDCLAKNKAEVKKPWRDFKLSGNSLFKFRLILTAGSALAFLAILVPIAVTVVAFKNSKLSVFAFIGIAVAVFVLFILFLILSAIGMFLADFVVPIMYIRRVKVIEAWKKFFQLLTDNFWKFVGYTLFKIVVGICIGMIIVMSMCIACCFCCVGIVFFIPYINTVVLLPIISFMRFYSLCYLRQYGPEFDVFVCQN